MWDPEKCRGLSSRLLVQLSSFSSPLNKFNKLWKKLITNGTGFVDGLGMGNNTKVSKQYLSQLEGI
jgi:hypothetical protein